MTVPELGMAGHDPAYANVSAKQVGRLSILASCLVLLFPLLAAPIPPLGDYPNHLARMWMLSSNAAQASVAQFYQVRFDTYTNIALDLIAVTVGKVLGWMAAGQFAVALAMVLPPLGGALFWRSVHRQTHWWMLSFGLLAFGGLMISGFINFQISLGLALLFAAVEPAIMARGIVIQILARAVFGVILLLAHPFGLLFYALLLCGIAIGPRLTTQAWQPALARLMPAGAAILGVVVLFVLLVPSLPGTQEHSGLLTIGSEIAEDFLKKPKRKLTNLLLAVRSYSNLVDGLTLLAFMAPLAWAAWRRTLQTHMGLLIVSALLLVAYSICPDYILGAAWVDARFSVMLPFTIAAACTPCLPRRAAAAWTVVLLAAFLGRVAFITDIWHARQADVTAVAAALEPLPAGATLFALSNHPADPRQEPRGRFTSSAENSFRHLSALAVPWRHAFVPTLFSARGKQPIVVLPPWDALSEPNGGMLNDIHVLDPRPPAEVKAETIWAQYTSQWRRFDYLLLLDADTPNLFGRFEMPAELTLVKDSGFAKLFKISH